MVGTEICRVSVHVDGGQADIALPAEIPVGQLIPSVYDILTAADGALAESLCHEPPTCLHLPGLPPLDPSMTLWENGIRDGGLLVLASAAVEHMPLQVVQTSDAVEHATHAQRRAWTTERSRLTALLVVITLAGVVGFVAVPDGIGAPNLLLSATASAAVGAISAHVVHYGRTALMALTCVFALVAATTLGATLFDIGGPRAGLALTVLSVGALTVPGRLPVVLSGLSAHIGRDLDPDSDGLAGDLWIRAGRAQQLLTALVVGASCAAALGIAAVMLLTSSPGWPACAVAGIVATIMVLRSRAYPEPIRRASLLGSGMACITALFAGIWLRDPVLAPWICAAAAVVATGAIWLGYDPPAVAGSLPVRRCLRLLDGAALVGVIPMACWCSGVYAAVRGMTL